MSRASLDHSVPVDRSLIDIRQASLLLVIECAIAFIQQA